MFICGFGFAFGKVLQLYNIVNFCILLEITVLNSIAEETLVGATRVRCNFTKYIFLYETYPNIYTAMFVSLRYIHVQYFDNRVHVYEIITGSDYHAFQDVCSGCFLRLSNGYNRSL